MSAIVMSLYEGVGLPDTIFAGFFKLPAESATFQSTPGPIIPGFSIFKKATALVLLMRKRSVLFSVTSLVALLPSCPADINIFARADDFTLYFWDQFPHCWSRLFSRYTGVDQKT
jgi:hypothetical protein